ncbi:MAG TPA: hypothetical protein DDX47_05780 [Candidatus Jacksonbacteria bacterium]|nr:hypothetical protein [Candidatus Jacksonbacteria bacterium]
MFGFYWKASWKMFKNKGSAYGNNFLWFILDTLYLILYTFIMSYPEIKFQEPKKIKDKKKLEDKLVYLLLLLAMGIVAAYFYYQSYLLKKTAGEYQVLGDSKTCAELEREITQEIIDGNDCQNHNECRTVMFPCRSFVNQNILTRINYFITSFNLKKCSPSIKSCPDYGGPPYLMCQDNKCQLAETGDYSVRALLNQTDYYSGDIVEVSIVNKLLVPIELPAKKDLGNWFVRLVKKDGSAWQLVTEVQPATGDDLADFVTLSPGATKTYVWDSQTFAQNAGLNPMVLKGTFRFDFFINKDKFLIFHTDEFNLLFRGSKVQIDTTCAGGDDCRWTATNCCQSSAGAFWECVNPRLSNLVCPEPLFCYNTLSPEPATGCGCRRGRCEESAGVDVTIQTDKLIYAPEESIKLTLINNLTEPLILKDSTELNEAVADLEKQTAQGWQRISLSASPELSDTRNLTTGASRVYTWDQQILAGASPVGSAGPGVYRFKFILESSVDQGLVFYSNNFEIQQ